MRIKTRNFKIGERMPVWAREYGFQEKETAKVYAPGYFENNCQKGVDNLFNEITGKYPHNK